MVEEHTKSHWLWRTLVRALPFGSVAQTLFQTITAVLALFAIYILQGEPQMTEELWWFLAVLIAVGFAYTLSFVWALTGDAQTPLDKNRRGAIIAAILAFGGSAFAFGRFGKNPEIKFAKSEDLTGKFIKNQTFRIVDIIEPKPPRIEDKHFENCRIFGPAVINLAGQWGVMQSCTFDDAIELIFWKIHPEQGGAVGLIQVSRCTFINCDFVGVGFVGHGGDIDEMRRKIRENIKT